MRSEVGIRWGLALLSGGLVPAPSAERLGIAFEGLEPTGGCLDGRAGLRCSAQLSSAAVLAKLSYITNYKLFKFCVSSIWSYYYREIRKVLF